jgi:hypothetical protein
VYYCFLAFFFFCFDLRIILSLEMFERLRGIFVSSQEERAMVVVG